MHRSTHRLGLAAILCLALTAAAAQEVPSKSPNTELDACKSTGLLALREKSPGLKDVLIDPDAVTIAKADTKVEDTAIRTVIMGEAYLEKKEVGGSQHFLCLIGDKGKVLLTFFTSK